ncbi:MAG TPA: histidine kinase [Candidatus Limnocylindria bacterium]|nr:histidine kinase [Candidatus Limnocylindria bacterium]
MKRQWLAFSRRYQAALHKHLEQASKSRVPPAHRLGEQAVTLGLETLDLARIHKSALTVLVLPGNSPAAKDRMVKCAEMFFTEAITPIEKTHRAGIKSAARLDRQNKTLNRRNAQLAAAKRHLKQGIVRRKAAEEALKTSEQHYAKLLEESHQLQKHLQKLTHRILSAQENERRKISHDLHDEIAQTLLGINVRLLALKKGAAARPEGLAKEIANAQRLVEKSVKSIDRFAREFRVQHEA